MDCESVASLLPWLVNGGLEDEERLTVERHVADCERCRRELERVREDFELHDAHPEADALSRYVVGELEEPRAVLVERHLELCEPCRGEVATLRAGRADFEAELGSLNVGGADSWRRSSAAGWRWAAIAAGLAAIVSTAGWLQSRLGTATVEGPAVNVALLEVAPVELVHRGEKPDNELVVGEHTGAITLILISQQDEELPDYEIVLTDGSGSVLWHEGGLLRNPEGDYTVSLPAAVVPEGELRATIRGMRNGRWIEVESYQIRVRR